MRKAYYSASVLSSTLDCGASYACEADDPEVVVRRATQAAKFGKGVGDMSGISGWSGYSLLTNNCETFACWCSTGRCVVLPASRPSGHSFNILIRPPYPSQPHHEHDTCTVELSC